MPKIIERRTRRVIGSITAEEYAQLKGLLDEPGGDVEELDEIDQVAFERLTQSLGADRRLMVLVRQILQGRGDFDLGWDSD